MFPKVFETTLYRDTEQITVCPRRDLLISPPASLSVYLQRQAEYTPTIDTNRIFEKEFSSPPNPPVQDVLCDLDGRQSRSPERDALESNWKTRRRGKTNKIRSIVGKKKRMSEAQMQQAISRRKKTNPERPLVPCRVPGCVIDSTTGFRLKTHIKGFHLDIRDNFCEWPGCSFATLYIGRDT